MEKPVEEKIIRENRKEIERETKPKAKRVGKYMGKTNAVKKAYIKLAEGSKIEILADK